MLKQRNLLLNYLIPLLLSSFGLMVLSQATTPDNEYKVLYIETTPDYISVVAKYMGTQKHYLKTNNPRLLILNVSIIFQGPSEFRVLITDRINKRWEIPDTEFYPHDKPNCNFSNKDLLYKVEVTKNPFSFKVLRKSTNEVLFDTATFPFILSDRYLEFSSILPSEELFGIGERVTKFKLQFPGLYTIWARDLPGRIDDLKSGSLNTYGLFPLYLIREKEGYFHLVYLRNSNGMDILLDKRDGVPNIRYKIVGGVIDLKFFFSEKKSPEEAVKQYHDYIGKYMLQPFWSLGFHQCRWGYTTWVQLEGVVRKFHEAGMPLDAIWMDIDYMQGYRIFTIDEGRYNLDSMQHMLQDVYKKRLVLILDPGVKVDGGYYAFNEGIKRDIYVKHMNGQPIKGSVWPGEVYFPDFFNPAARNYWRDMLQTLYDKVKFAGIWLDMNEFSNFVNGASGQSCDYPEYDYYNVYLPGRQALDNHAVCLNAFHIDGLIEYNVHNFNGYMETIATYEYLKENLKQDQPFILSRSTVPGSGRFTTHWTGDNVSTYEWMRLSIAGILSFNIFGVPYVGADICGFDQSTTEELCIRWMQLGTLYPFSRNHNHHEARDQDAFSFGDPLKQASMATLKFRYSILKYYYYLFVRNHGSGTVFRPLFFEFPEDNGCYNNNALEEQFLIGDAILVTPVLDQGVTEINPYFPGKDFTWYDIQTGKDYTGSSNHQIFKDLTGTAPIFLRSGESIYRQNVQYVNRTEDLSNEIYFSVAFSKKLPNDKQYSKGEFMACENYHDYEKLKKCVDGDCLIDVDFFATKNDTFQGIEINLSPSNSSGNNSYDNVSFTGLEMYGTDLFDDVSGKQISIHIYENNEQRTLNYTQQEVKWSTREQIKVLSLEKSFELKKEQKIVVKFN